MKKQYIFKCPLTKYFIVYVVDIDNNYAYVNTIFTDYQNIKAFLALMRNSIEQLRNLKIDKIRQTVDNTEWQMYLKGKTSWIIISNDTFSNTSDIECSIGDFLENYGVGIGLNKN